MKHFLGLLLIIISLSTLALSGTKQEHVETLYDRYRAQYLAPFSTEKQVEILSKTQKALAQYLQRPTLSTPVREMVLYLEHLFCQTKSLLTGNYCENNYQPSSLLTTNKNQLSLAQIRVLLIREHTKRRIERNLGALADSETLNIIAQDYAEKLCQAGEITHTLNGSTLEQRYEIGQYDYIW